MSVSVYVTGKFKNGKTRTAGLHLPYNSVIDNQQLLELNNKINTEIYENFDRFKGVIVGSDMYFTTTLTPPYRSVRQVYSKEELASEIKRVISEMNKLIISSNQK